jgi:hypothetical protein
MSVNELLNVSWVLGCFAVACLIAAGLAGRYWYGASHLWDWADPIYYPLAILGIFLLFLSNEKARAIADARVEKAAAAEDFQEHTATKPPGPDRDLRSGLVPVSYKSFEIYRELADVCKGIPSPDEKCQLAIKQAPMVEDAFHGFNPAASQSPEMVEDYCNRGYRLIDSLAKGSTVGSFIYEELKESFASVASEGQHPLAYEVTEARKEDFVAQMRRKSAYLITTFPERDRELYRRHWEEQLQLANNVYAALSLCLRVQPGDRESLDTLRRWKAQGEKLTAQAEGAEKKLLELQADRPPSPREVALSFVNLRLWPFVLTLALALKFAKGIAGLRKGNVERAKARGSTGSAPSLWSRSVRPWLYSFRKNRAAATRPAEDPPAPETTPNPKTKGGGPA